MLEQEFKQDVQEPNSLLSKPMQAASEVVAAKIALFSSEGKASLYSQGVRR